MDGKCISCEKNLDLTEGPIMEYCTPCVKTVKTPSDEKLEKQAKSKGEPVDFENAELNRQIANLVKQPRMIEFIKRLKAMEETVR